MPLLTLWAFVTCYRKKLPTYLTAQLTNVSGKVLSRGTQVENRYFEPYLSFSSPSQVFEAQILVFYP